MSALRFGSVASGIEAASVAFEPLGWEAAWFSEIEKFPSAVLEHHYPEVLNVGDMTQLPALILEGTIEAPDVLCGGTPCQAFSIAGLRNSLSDARGNLSLTFCEIANAIDTKRRAAGDSPSVVLWENVPGALSTSDNFFGCFLGALAGEDVPLEPAGGRWSNAGCVYGPERAIAWRVLNAEHFGVPQRRKRLLVVACPLERAHPTQILFEFEGERRDSAPSRDPQEVVAGSLKASSGGVDQDSTLIVQPPVAACLTATSAFVDQDSTLIVQPYAVANCMTARMYKGINTTLDEGQTPVLAYRVAGDGAAYASEEITAPLLTGTDPSANLVLAFHENQRAELTVSETMGSLKCGGGKPGQGYPAVLVGPQVRRLLPIECERLQGFPDNYTNVPGASDTSRYKALGNSWPVPMIRWVGARISEALR